MIDIPEPAYSVIFGMFYYTSTPNWAGWIPEKVFHRLLHETSDGVFRKYYKTKELAMEDYVQAAKSVKLL